MGIQGRGAGRPGLAAGPRADAIAGLEAAGKLERIGIAENVGDVTYAAVALQQQQVAEVQALGLEESHRTAGEMLIEGAHEGRS